LYDNLVISLANPLRLKLLLAAHLWCFSGPQPNAYWNSHYANKNRTALDWTTTQNDM